MDALLLLAAKVAASACIGMLIGLERSWAHKEAGVRSFAIATLLGTLSWLVAPTLAYVQVGIVLVVLILVNVYAMRNEQPPEITTSLALAAANVLGIVIGMGNFFLAFTSALVVTALLAWKTELITFISKLTVAEIRSTILFGFIAGVIYPLLPNRFIDPWQVLNPRSVWLTVVIVSGLSFVNYVLLRQFGTRGIRYSAILGGLVNSAATVALLGQEVRDDATAVAEAPTDVVLSDLAMILRNCALVVIFSFPQGIRASMSTVIVLVPMMLAAGIVALFDILGGRRSKQKPSHHLEQEAPQQFEQEAPQKRRLESPLELRSVLGFSMLFLSLTVISGLANRLFGTIGFLVIVVVGAVASAASSSVLVGQQLSRGYVAGSPAAIAMFLATLVGLLENVVIFWIVTRMPGPSLRLLLLTAPIVLAGILVVVLVTIFGW
ncbi:MAG: MgtC/SapB family protein [Chloroflexi bacterium]|nr:MAG: MgtC/SapB family protein [Chloroflexota bacterium]TMD38979.1 MAG: MgtC/SapB family protein [Chloroflexota bacterium]